MDDVALAFVAGSPCGHGVNCWAKYPCFHSKRFPHGEWLTMLTTASLWRTLNSILILYAICKNYHNTHIALCMISSN